MVAEGSMVKRRLVKRSANGKMTIEGSIAEEVDSLAVKYSRLEDLLQGSCSKSL